MAMLNNDELSKAIVAFLTDYSIEITPHDEGKLDEIRNVLSPGTAVYIAHPPNSPIDDVVKVAGKVQKLGFRATPHIIARKLESRGQLEQALAALQGLGVDHALAVAGDITAAQPAFDSSLEVLQTGLFSKYGFREVGVAGHPEGSKAIGDERVEKALRGKAAFAATADFKVYFATQFGFDPTAFTDWEAATTAKGITLPIHVGMPGPASLRQLAKFAMLCGVGASMRMLTQPYERDGEPAQHAGAGRDGHESCATPGGAPGFAFEEGSLLCFRRCREDGALGECGGLRAVRLEQRRNWLPG